jgi:uncharacterized C2H2 Zn-finger protein
MEKIILFCDVCGYTTKRKYDYTKHLHTKKHWNKINNLTQRFQCDKCNKVYKYRQGLYKHKLKCNADNTISKQNQNQNIYSDQNKDVIVSNMVESVENKQHQELSDKSMPFLEILNKYIENTNKVQEYLMEQNNKLHRLKRKMRQTQYIITYNNIY